MFFFHIYIFSNLIIRLTGKCRFKCFNENEKKVEKPKKQQWKKYSKVKTHNNLLLLNETNVKNRKIYEIIHFRQFAKRFISR